MKDEARREHVGRVVRKEIRLDATPEQVWEAWARAERIARWFVDAAEGDMDTSDVVTWVFEHFGYRLPIEVHEAVPGERLAFGGEPPGRPPALQEVVVEQDGGSTILRLANSGFGEGAEWDEEYAGVDSGWDMALATLKLWLERYEGGRRTHLLAVLPAAFRFADLVPLYTTAAGLASWLGEGVELHGELGPGASVRLDVPGAGPLAGEVLAWSGRELLLAWPEQHGALGLKAFSMGPQTRVALDFNAWTERPLGAERRADLQAALDGALERLAARLEPGA